MRQTKRPSPAAILGILLALTTGCSLCLEKARPVPDSGRNLSCFVEYRPSLGESDQPDLLLLATANPYKLDEVSLNPIDTLVHAAFAPGRHLQTPARIEGATCETPAWKSGRRVPGRVRPHRGMLCKRTGLAGVVIEAETRYGRCRVEIPAGDPAPVCKEWPEGIETEIRGILREPCRAQDG